MFRKRLVLVISVIFGLYEIVVLSNIPGRFFGVPVEPMVFRAGHVFFILIISFLLYPLKKGVIGQIVDGILIAFSVASTMFIFFRFDHEVFRAINTGAILLYQQVLGAGLIIAMLEATRRILGAAFPGICLFFGLHAIYSNYFPGFLNGIGYSWKVFFFTQYFTTDGIWGIPITVSATLIYSFILFGNFLGISGASDAFMKLAFALVGNIRGGASKVAVVSSAMMGTMTGSATALVGTIGVITIPMMKSSGYPSHYAAAVQATSSIGAMIMPPVMGAAAFVMAQWLGIAYWKVATAAAIPAVLYFLCLFLQTDLRSAKLGLKGIDREQLPSLKSALQDSWMFMFPLVLLIYLMGALHWGPEAAVMGALLLLIVLSMFKKKTRLNLNKVIKAFDDTGRTMPAIASACGSAGILVGAIALSGLGIRISGSLVEISGGNTVLLALITAVASMVLGTALPPTASYIFLAAMVAPAMVKAGLLPLASHLFIFYYGIIGDLTPPLCVSVFLAAGIAKAPLMKTAFAAMQLGIVAYFAPFLFLFHPALIMAGPWHLIIGWFAFTVAATLFMAAAIEGFLFDAANLFHRILWGVGALIIFLPFPLAYNFIGLAIGIIATLLHWLSTRRRLSIKKLSI